MKIKNQISKLTLRNFSTSTSLLHPSQQNLSPLHPWFLTGFSDAESSFILKVYKTNKIKTGWSVGANFSIELHIKDKALLEMIQASLGGVGSIIIGEDTVRYTVYSKDLAVIIDHFDNYPLITQKRADFELFKLAVELINKKEHLTMEGLNKIVSIKASLNKGLNEELQTAFPNVIPASRPIVDLATDIDPNWLAGFTEGEGCFFVQLMKSKTHKAGVQVLLQFRLTQHLRDQALLNSLIEYFGCGSIVAYSKSSSVIYVVSKISEVEKIVRFFEKYPLQGVKGLDFADFCKVAEIVKNKRHLTESGLEEIRLIKAGMNRGRSV